MGIEAIETQYQGCRFRSRLEARWAVFFDAMGIEWEYEKEGYDCGELGWYLPDFWLPDLRVWVEIKAGHATRQERKKLIYVVENTDCAGGCFLTRIPSDVEKLEEERYSRAKVDVCDYPFAFDSEVSLDVTGIRMKEGEPTELFGGLFHKISCPICGCENVYLGYATRKHSTDYSAWEGSGDAIRIMMSCRDRPHEWVLMFGFHDGALFTRIETIVETNHDPLVWFGIGDKERVNRALINARSARFEHGEENNAKGTY